MVTIIIIIKISLKETKTTRSNKGQHRLIKLKLINLINKLIK
jgi:hypothetical protein